MNPSVDDAPCPRVFFLCGDAHVSGTNRTTLPDRVVAEGARVEEGDPEEEGARVEVGDQKTVGDGPAVADSREMVGEVTQE